MDDGPDVHALYNWTCTMEAELEELKNAFPEFLAVERNRLILAAKFFRISLEVRLQPRFPRRPDRPREAVRPQDLQRRQDQ